MVKKYAHYRLSLATVADVSAQPVSNQSSADFGREANQRSALRFVANRGAFEEQLRQRGVMG